MSAMAIFVASILVTPVNNNRVNVPIAPATITVQKQVLTDPTNANGKCRKLEAAYHNGNGSSVKRGNKIVSQVTSPDGFYVTETTTFCVEI
ncbi:hypothetical protein ST201phi2-1p014 [Pseudomonas phage 201phi2-1]|uniref:Uncharacterized protein n=1 Tax=Pseudomonas phage 201phi2-1 TaxID=198110 RepID=B3FJZ0_BP201|nr:hypothetical protein ST201phi2-1p014 [Pseudomonas phage 201phi2-1]ABY62848.1 hypothetical protein 201phi2-1p014 [Pseudomonas phage 201phi2-1]